MAANNADIGIWKLSNNQPERYNRAVVELERHLEDWLERDGTLIQAGLVIVGRQVRTEAGPLDLLGLDQFGRWAVIEIKRGSVRRETIAQACDYAGCIAELPAEALRAQVTSYLKPQGIRVKALLERLQLDESVFDTPRDVQVFVVGTARDASFDRLAKHMSFHGNPVNAVTFDVFQNEAGERLLLRQLTELDEQNSAPLPQPPAPVPTTPKAPAKPQETPPANAEIQRLFKLADKNRVGKEFRLIYEAATRNGLYPRTYKWSIMYTPPNNKSRVALCAWVKPRYGLFDLAVVTAGFCEFYPVAEKDVMNILGLRGQRPRLGLTHEQVTEFASSLDVLFAKINAKR
jgi:hypothetical protein